MHSFIKVCGIQNIFEANGTIEAGANTIGMLIGVPEYVEDKISPETAREIVASFPRGIRSVMVTHLLETDKISELAGYTGVSSVQVHNELPVNELASLRKKIPGLEIIKTVHVVNESAVKEAKMYEPYSDMILLDSKSGARIGGTGKTHDWNISKKIVEQVKVPVVLAGGLNPENIEEAVKKVMPFGIDANSGLEYEDGSKDFEKVRIFAEAGALLS